MAAKYTSILNKVRGDIASTIRTSRLARRWTQKEVAEKIGMSQARLSQLERGLGSFAAEHVFLLAQLFNIPVGQFAPANDGTSLHSQLQNALARLGAVDLLVDPSVAPSEQFADVATVAREALLLATPRLLTALAPVMVKHIDRLNLPRLDAQLQEVGLGRRVAWLADNVLAAIELERQHALPAEFSTAYRRAETVIGRYLDDRRAAAPPAAPQGVDVLDATIRSQRSLEHVVTRASDIARRWGVATDLRPEDFAAALEAARAPA
jgi:transcriptional regulator with XRE-family HTH domain